MSETMGRDLAPHGSVWPPFLQHAGPDFFTWCVPRAAKADKPRCPRAFQTFAGIVVASILLAKTSHLTEPSVRAGHSKSHSKGLPKWGLEGFGAVFAVFHSWTAFMPRGSVELPAL